MKTWTSRTVAFALAWLALAAATRAQQARPGATPPENSAKGKGRAFSGRVVDGLGRPVAGMKVTVRPRGERQEKASEMVLRTDDDGRYSGTLPPNVDDARIETEKDGYSNMTTVITGGFRAFTLHRKVDWGDDPLLYLREGDELDRGVRELLASEEWQIADDRGLLAFLFEHQDEFRPALRRLIGDAHVGIHARYWLDLLGDPADGDLFPKGRRSTPKKEVKEADLVEALKATARQRNFFSSAPEPDVSIDFIVFTKKLDRVLIQCGINLAPFTGMRWRFVFWRVGKQWELRSAMEAGRS